MSNTNGLPLTEETGLFDAEVGVNLLDLHGASPEAMSPEGQAEAAAKPAAGAKPYSYEPVVWHWFYLKEVDKKSSWKPFSMLDSVSLEETYQLLMDGQLSEDEAVVSTDGGRYDVLVATRSRTAVYWEENASEVRRCSWFFKGPLELTYTPYEEEMAEKLEEEYHRAMDRNLWHRILEFPHGEKVTFQTPNVMLHFPNTGSVDDWNQVTDRQMQALIVKRGIEGFDIGDGESTTVDHLIFLVHGIGSVCDFRFRPIVEVVDDFRALSYQLLRSHFPAEHVGRVEFLPVSWHAPLHGDDTGIDKRLEPITLPSIPKLRHFANDTILDVLFYTSPVYCETIISTVGLELNRLYNTFRQRNPSFTGEISLGGHSLGSLILFDLLVHQPFINKISGDGQNEPRAQKSDTEESADPSLDEVCQVLQLGEYLAVFEKEQLTLDDLLLCTEEDLLGLGLPLGPRKRLATYLRDLQLRRTRMSQRNGTDVASHMSTVSYTVGLAGTGQPSVSYPLLDFQPAAFYALGSPVAMFVTVRGIDRLGEDFILPTCPRFFNIFHPYDPVAYRIETLIDAKMVDVPPVLIPHHKGRKRMHIELKETITRYSADFERFLGSVRATWNNFSTFHRSASLSAASPPPQPAALSDDAQAQEVDADAGSPLRSAGDQPTVHIGSLNGGNRIDYVLQEAPLESFNEYLFALTSHVGYWESEDTMLLILKESYSPLGVYPDKTVAP